MRFTRQTWASPYFRTSTRPIVKHLGRWVAQHPKGSGATHPADQDAAQCKKVAGETGTFLGCRVTD
jgi:hypothetical protein